MNASDTWKTPVDKDFLLTPHPIIGALTLAGFIAVLVSDRQADTGIRFAYLLFAAFSYFSALTALLLYQRYPEAVRWLLCFLLVAVVTGGLSVLQGMAFLSLLPIPIVVAILLVGFPSALVVTLTQSICLILAYQHWPMGIGNLLIVQVSLWLTFFLLVVLYSSARRIADWSLYSTQRQQRLLEDARERMLDQEQILDELMHANRQLDLMNERLASARLMAEEAQKAKSVFAAKVSHEFRTPLNMIIGLTDLLIETPDVYGDALPAALLEDLQIVHRNCMHLTSMINDVLAISQMEAGRLSLHREWVNLEAEIESAIAVVAPLVEKKGLALHVRIPATLPDVYCDQTRIRQVILNLISNAARYTERGTIVVEVVINGPTITVSITDTGPGIDSQDLELIFEPFYQRTGNVWRENAGNGLGLAISRQFIELHGGRIWAESTPGSGSMFAFRLPVSPFPSPAASTARWINEEWMWVERTERPDIPQLPYRRRIVLCDETGELSSLAVESAQAVEIVNAENLKAAITAIDECPAHALILNTASMDRMWSAIDDARRNLPDTPIFSYTLPHSIDLARVYGVFKYLIKPITRADLRAVLAGLERAPARVLVVDDDRDFRSLLVRMLGALAPTLEVMEAQNGEQALHLLRDQAPDLIFLDIVMPNYDGWHFLDLKNCDSDISDIPVVIVSAQDPLGQALSRGTLVTTIGEGISKEMLLRCVCDLAELLTQPAPAPDQTPATTPHAEPA